MRGCNCWSGSFRIAWFADNTYLREEKCWPVSEKTQAALAACHRILVVRFEVTEASDTEDTFIVRTR